MFQPVAEGLIEPPRRHSSSRGMWRAVVSLAIISFSIAGPSAVVIGLLVDRWMVEFRWPNGLTSSIATAFNLAALLVAPAVGVMIDKWGATATIALGAATACAGFLLAAHAYAHVTMMGAFVLIGIGYSGSCYVPSAVAISSWMPSKRSLGMGIVLGAASVGAAAFAPIIDRCIELYGWRMTCDWLALLCATMAPLALLAIRTPTLAESALPIVGDPTPTRPERSDLFSKAFVALAGSSALFAAAMYAIYYHVISLLEKAGYSSKTASFVLGFTWVMSALGSLLLGATALRFGAKRVLAVAMCSCAAGTLLLTGSADSRIGVACVALFSILWGASANCVNQFVPVILGNIFGPRHLGVLVGVLSLVMGLVGAGAPVATGLLYDAFGSYLPSIYLSSTATIGALLLLVFVGRAQGAEVDEEKTA